MVDEQPVLELRKQNAYRKDMDIGNLRKKYPIHVILVDYDHEPRELVLRDYQEELVEHACKGKNTIVVAPTGAGKTEVAVFVAREHIEKREKSGLPSRVCAGSNLYIYITGCYVGAEDSFSRTARGAFS